MDLRGTFLIYRFLFLKVFFLNLHNIPNKIKYVFMAVFSKIIFFQIFFKRNFDHLTFNTSLGVISIRRQSDAMVLRGTFLIFRFKFT